MPNPVGLIRRISQAVTGAGKIAGRSDEAVRGMIKGEHGLLESYLDVGQSTKKLVQDVHETIYDAMGLSRNSDGMVIQARSMNDIKALDEYEQGLSIAMGGTQGMSKLHRMMPDNFQPIFHQKLGQYVEDIQNLKSGDWNSIGRNSVGQSLQDVGAQTGNDVLNFLTKKHQADLYKTIQQMSGMEKGAYKQFWRTNLNDSIRMKKAEILEKVKGSGGASTMDIDDYNKLPAMQLQDGDMLRNIDISGGEGFRNKFSFTSKSGRQYDISTKGGQTGSYGTKANLEQAFQGGWDTPDIKMVKDSQTGKFLFYADPKTGRLKPWIRKYHSGEFEPLNLDMSTGSRGINPEHLRKLQQMGENTDAHMLSFRIESTADNMADFNRFAKEAGEKGLVHGTDEWAAFIGKRIESASTVESKDMLDALDTFKLGAISSSDNMSPFSTRALGIKAWASRKMAERSTFEGLKGGTSIEKNTLQTINSFDRSNANPGVVFTGNPQNPYKFNTTGQSKMSGKIEIDPLTYLNAPSDMPHRIPGTKRITVDNFFEGVGKGTKETKAETILKRATKEALEAPGSGGTADVGRVIEQSLKEGGKAGTIKTKLQLVAALRNLLNGVSRKQFELMIGNQSPTKFLDAFGAELVDGAKTMKRHFGQDFRLQWHFPSMKPYSQAQGAAERADLAQETVHITIFHSKVEASQSISKADLRNKILSVMPTIPGIKYNIQEKESLGKV